MTNCQSASFSITFISSPYTRQQISTSLNIQYWQTKNSTVLCAVSIPAATNQFATSRTLVQRWHFCLCNETKYNMGLQLFWFTEYKPTHSRKVITRYITLVTTDQTLKKRGPWSIIHDTETAYVMIQWLSSKTLSTKPPQHWQESSVVGVGVCRLCTVGAHSVHGFVISSV